MPEENIEISEDNVVRAIELGLIFDVPDVGTIRQIMRVVRFMKEKLDRVRSIANYYEKTDPGMTVSGLAREIEKVLDAD
jgi:hypothetical protein